MLVQDLAALKVPVEKVADHALCLSDNLQKVPCRAARTLGGCHRSATHARLRWRPGTLHDRSSAALPRVVPPKKTPAGQQGQS